jgi:hypothetical protein
MDKIKHVEYYICEVCGQEYDSSVEAENCFNAHLEGYNRKSPKYEIGKQVITHRFNDYDFGEEKTTIIKVRGEFLNFRFLVENNAGERYWVKPFRYQTIDFSKDSAPFYFVPLAE